MSEIYKIDNTNGTSALTLAPGETNGPFGINYDTDLQLHGKGYHKWGENINENFYRLLETFACEEKPGVTPPVPKDATDIGQGPNFGINKPILGQLWYNTTRSQLFVYSVDPSNATQNIWIAVGSTSLAQPIDPQENQLWYDPDFYSTGDGQLVIFTNGAWHSVAEKYLLLTGGTLSGQLTINDQLFVTGSAEVEQLTINAASSGNKLIIKSNSTNTADQTGISFNLSDNTSIATIGNTSTNSHDLVLRSFNDNINLYTPGFVNIYTNNGVDIRPNITGNSQLQIISTGANTTPTLSLQADNSTPWTLQHNYTNLNWKYGSQLTYEISTNGNITTTGISNTDQIVNIVSPTNRSILQLTNSLSQPNYSWEVSTFDHDFQLKRSDYSTPILNLSSTGDVTFTPISGNLNFELKSQNDVNWSLSTNNGANVWEFKTNDQQDTLELYHSANIPMLQINGKTALNGISDIACLSIGNPITMSAGSISGTIYNKNFGVCVDTRFSSSIDVGGIGIQCSDTNNDESAIAIIAPSISTGQPFNEYSRKLVFDVRATTGHVYCDRVFTTNIQNVTPINNELVTKSYVDDASNHHTVTFQDYARTNQFPVVGPFIIGKQYFIAVTLYLDSDGYALDELRVWDAYYQQPIWYRGTTNYHTTHVNLVYSGNNYFYTETLILTIQHSMLWFDAPYRTAGPNAGQFFSPIKVTAIEI